MVNKKLTPLLLALLTGMLVFSSFIVNAQEENKKNIYDPTLDGREEIARYVEQASKEGKHVLLQVGGNW